MQDVRPDICEALTPGKRRLFFVLASTKFYEVRLPRMAEYFTPAVRGSPECIFKMFSNLLPLKFDTHQLSCGPRIPP